MSGGSYDYAFRHVESMACDERQRRTPLRRAFAAHLQLVAEAMRAVEWVDSGDNGLGDEDELIRKVLAPGAELAEAIRMAEDARAALEGVLARARSTTQPASEKGGRTR